MKSCSLKKLSIIRYINRDLSLLYMKARVCSPYKYLCISDLRSDNENFYSLLTKVEKKMKQIKRVLVEDEEAFCDQFPFISYFIYEARNMIEDEEESNKIKKKFIDIARNLYKLGFCY